MGTGGMRRLVTAVAVVSAGLVLGACGNQSDGGTPTAGGQTTVTVTTTPPSAERSIPEPAETPSAVPKPVQQATTATLKNSMLLTGADVDKADPQWGWDATKASADPICGPSSIRGNGVRGSLNRNFSTGMDAIGGQWITRYDDEAAAKAAYAKIVATIKSCKALVPAPTHARELTENRTLPVGDATVILRWYDYPLPSDPGSEPGGFPYAVTRDGAVVSVLAFSEMGDGMKAANFEKLARTAADRLS
ncbi:hypothetical protein ACIBL3_01020 [Kribbella sp. NPDC050124]|uniref:hypothetical protein n=1 Tax=Kribbella sp. NPDC050124 TaxID=3364114 RepID=UPI0037B3755C